MEKVITMASDAPEVSLGFVAAVVLFLSVVLTGSIFADIKRRRDLRKARALIYEELQLQEKGLKPEEVELRSEKATQHGDLFGRSWRSTRMIQFRIRELGIDWQDFNPQDRAEFEAMKKATIGSGF